MPQYINREAGKILILCGISMILLNLKEIEYQTFLMKLVVKKLKVRLFMTCLKKSLYVYKSFLALLKLI